MSRHCLYCGGVGPRTVVAGGWAHKRCIPQYKVQRPVSTCEPRDIQIYCQGMRPTEETQKFYGLRMPPSLRARVAKAAKRVGQNMNEWIRAAITKCLDAADRKRRKA